MPPVAFATMSEAASRGEGVFHETRAARRAPWADASYFDGTPLEFDAPVVDALPATGYGEFDQGLLLRRAGWPITAAGTLLTDAVFLHEQERYQDFRSVHGLSDAVRLTGTTVNLATAFASTNYAHALLDGIGRLGLLIEGGYDISDADHIVMTGFRTPDLDRITADLGIREERIVRTEPHTRLVCDRLVQTALPGRERQYTEAPSVALRSLGYGTGERRRRLLLTREGDKRAVANAEALEEVAARWGLERFEPRDDPFAPDAFADAELVVGAHGAALANLAFCAAGTAVVEIMPDHHRFPYYASLACSGGLRYTAVAGTPVVDERHAHFTVDPEELDAAIDLVMS